MLQWFQKQNTVLESFQNQHILLLECFQQQKFPQFSRNVKNISKTLNRRWKVKTSNVATNNKTEHITSFCSGTFPFFKSTKIPQERKKKKTVGKNFLGNTRLLNISLCFVCCCLFFSHTTYQTITEEEDSNQYGIKVCITL